MQWMSQKSQRLLEAPAAEEYGTLNVSLKLTDMSGSRSDEDF